jgi:hypothetical protein
MDMMEYLVFDSIMQQLNQVMFVQPNHHLDYILNGAITNLMEDTNTFMSDVYIQRCCSARDDIIYPEDLGVGVMERSRHGEVARDRVLEPWMVAHLGDGQPPVGAHLKHA